MEEIVEEEPPEQRVPKHILSDIEKEQIKTMLARPDVNYNIAACARLLGVTYGSVESFVRRDPYLSAKCPGKDAEAMVLDDNQAMERPPLPPADGGVVMTQEEFDKYQAFLRQSRRMMSKDWEALGLTKDQGEKMEGYGKLGGAPLGQLIRTTHGNLIQNLVRLDEIVALDYDRIIAEKFPQEFKADGSPKDPEVVAREWRHTLYSGIKLQLDMHVQIARIQAMMAQVQKNMQAAMMRGTAQPKGKLAASATAPRTSKADAET